MPVLAEYFEIIYTPLTYFSKFLKIFKSSQPRTQKKSKFEKIFVD
ncbi:26389_t:CDS:2 [Gigaspora margarita]|uniref:26389_t:CDS:1 n=1 Tax=Gigaspora margarita TaxID=4874 RepID=A0ABM8W5Y6_GIGMA|nr:26389_t:CDS:2 [Gigaspora margarita]